MHKISREARFYKASQLHGHDSKLRGRPTPWGSWISCEETTVARDGAISEGDPTRYTENHGYVLEVPVSAAPRVTPPVALKALAVDPRTGIVYETEDSGSNLFYRFLPNESGNLRRGGQLQALRLKNGVTNPANRPNVPTFSWPQASPCKSNGWS